MNTKGIGLSTRWAIAMICLLQSTPLFPAGHLDVGAVLSGEWLAESGIRLDLSSQDAPGTVGFHSPAILQIAPGKWRMYYDATGTGVVVSAVSADGLAWTKEPGVRLSPAEVGTIPAHPHVLQLPDGRYRMYFEGGPGDSIGSAVSLDGLSWKVEPGARIAPGVDPVVLQIGTGGYRMYFRQDSFSDNNVRSATSLDGLAWVREDGVRVTGAAEFAVARECDGTVTICHSRYPAGRPQDRHTAILCARSTDGLSFAGSNAALAPGNNPPWDNGRIVTTVIARFTDDVVRMYYQASSGSNVNDRARILSATATIGGACEGGCTRSQGYWKNHHRFVANASQRIPWPIDEETSMCGRTWLEILRTPPKGGDAWLILGRQWVAAQLNLEGAKSSPTEIPGAIAQGGRLLNDCAISTSEKDRAAELANLLDNYNNGRLEPGHCD